VNASTGKDLLRAHADTLNRLVQRLRQRQERARAYPRLDVEDEVRELIYGWHSGTVERPEPLDRGRLERRVAGA
jgi:hypothetical protein